MEMLRRRWFGRAAGAVAVGLSARGASAGLARAGFTFEVFQDAKSEYRWRLKAVNGQIVATAGEGYKAKADCMHGIELVQKEAAAAKVMEMAAKS